jgi:D-alanyl-D-alanine carboxypeptidase
LRSEPTAAATLTQTNVAAGSTDPIRPVLVKTLTVRPGVRTASLVAPQVASPAAEAQSVAAPAPMAAAKAEPAVPSPAPVAAEPPAPPPAPVAAAKSEPAAVPPEVATKPEPAPAPVAAAAPAVPTPKPAPAAKVAAATSTAKPAAAAPTAKPQHRPGWMIQVGAYPAEQAAKQRLSTVQSKASKMLTGAEAFTETVDKGGTTYYRARFAGLDKDKAEAACKYLKKNDVECVTIKN